MDILVTSSKHTDTGKEMFVGVTKHYVTALVYNAANRALRGPGKTFHGEHAFEAALKHYKSGACKAMIEHARAEAR